jgi:hypothetical protein
MGKYADALKRINDIAEATEDVAKEMRGETDSSYVRRKIDFTTSKTRVFLESVVSAVDGDFKDEPANDVARRLVTMLLVTDALEGLFERIGVSDEE